MAAANSASVCACMVVRYFMGDSNLRGMAAREASCRLPAASVEPSANTCVPRSEQKSSRAGTEIEDDERRPPSLARLPA